MTTSRRVLPLLAGLVLAAALVVGATVPSAGAAVVVRGQDSPSVSVPPIIPQPNSGKEPDVQGDPGSTAQQLVFFGMCGAVVLIGVLVVLESRRKLRRRAEAEQRAAQTRSSTRSEPVADTSAKRLMSECGSE